MKKSPLAQVKEEFGSKQELVSRLKPLLERNEGESDEAFDLRINTTSNRKLLRLWATEHAVKDGFGSREKLVDAIVQLKFGKSNADFAARLGTYSKARLLDLHRALSQKAA